MTLLRCLGRFFFDKAAGQLVLIVAVVAALIGSFAIEQRRIGASSVVADINQKAEVLSEKARQARKPAMRPGAADRLRQRYCRDCK